MFLKNVKRGWGGWVGREVILKIENINDNASNYICKLNFAYKYTLCT